MVGRRENKLVLVSALFLAACLALAGAANAEHIACYDFENATTGYPGSVPDVSGSAITHNMQNWDLTYPAGSPSGGGNLVGNWNPASPNGGADGCLDLKPA